MIDLVFFHAGCRLLVDHPTVVRLLPTLVRGSSPLSFTFMLTEFTRKIGMRPSMSGEGLRSCRAVPSSAKMHITFFHDYLMLFSHKCQ